MVDTGIDTNGALPQAEVTFGAGFTKPTEAFANVKVFVSLKVQCAVGEQDEVYNFCEEWVNERLSENMTALNEQYPSD